MGADDARADLAHAVEEGGAEVVVEVPAAGGPARRVPERVHLPAGRAELGGPRGHPVELVGSRVRVDDRVGEHAAGAGVAVDHLAGGGDVGVVDHRVALEARRRREEGDRGLAAGEHAGGPGGGRQVVGVDRVAPALGLHHPEEAHERGGAGGGVAARADEVRLHVDHRPERREALVGGRRVDLRLGGDVEEPAAVLGVEGPQRGGRADPVAEVLGRRQVETVARAGRPGRPCGAAPVAAAARAAPVRTRRWTGATAAGRRWGRTYRAA